MDKITMIISTLILFLNAISVIVTFIMKAKKPIDKAVDNRFKESLEPIYAKLSTIEHRTDKIDENQCRNFLVNFLSDIENGLEKDDIQIKRAYEVYEHYTKDLHKNSYIHDKWERLMK